MFLKKLDVPDIKEDFKFFLKDQDEFSDYDLTQSGIDQILTILAYGIHYDSIQANFSNAEMFLSSAQMRKNVTGRAKALKYFPKSRTSALAVIDIIAEERDGQTLPTTLFLPKGSQFAVASTTTQSYYFTTREAYVAQKSGSIYRFEDVRIYEGVYSNVSKKYINGQMISIPDSNVDTSSVEVYVREDPNSNVYSKYEKVQSIIGLTGEDRIFYLEENYNELYGIYFGDGLLGKKLQDGTDVLITYQISSGLEGNNLSSFTFVKSPDKDDEFNQARTSVFTKAVSSGGAEIESIESIKFNAPKFYSTQGIILNEDSANYIIPTIFSDIKSVNLWSGKGTSFGRTYISLNPYEDNLTQDRIDEILLEIESKRMAILTSLIYIPPTYLDMEIRLNVFFDRTKSVSEIETELYRRILDFSKNNIEDYKKNFISSKFITEITPTLLGYDFSLGVISRQTVFPNSLESYGFNFYNAVTSVRSNDFTYQGSTCHLESRDSTLVIISETGQMVRNNAGSINLTTGSGIIQNINIQAIEDNTLKMIGEPLRESIFAKENAICRILEDDIQISYEVVS